MVARGLLQRQLDEALETGVAFEHEESALGLACVAAPGIGSDGDPVAAISVMGPTTRFLPETHVAAVRAAATGLAST